MDYLDATNALDWALAHGFEMNPRISSNAEALRLADYLSWEDADSWPDDSWSNESLESLAEAIRDERKG